MTSLTGRCQRNSTYSAPIPLNTIGAKQITRGNQTFI